MSAWLRKVRRRRPGIYLARTRKHLNPRRRENGYVGLSNNVKLRQADHLGVGRYGNAAKPWTDLDPQWHVLPLPWWLGWRWVLAPLEFVAIKVLLPRYNVTHNRGNPRRVDKYRQTAQRRVRDAAAVGQPNILAVQRQADILWRVLAALFLVAAGAMAVRAGWR